MKLPFLLLSINKGEMKQLGELLEAIFNEPFRGMPDMASYFFWNLMEMVQLIPNHPY
jgi:hypothetical protein